MQELQRETAARRDTHEQPVLAEREEIRWVKMELALVLAAATGRRLGSIRQRYCEDVDFERHTIRWRAEFDKTGKEWVVPVPASLTEELKQFQKRLGAISGWIFGGERKPDQPSYRQASTVAPTRFGSAGRVGGSTD